MTGCTRIGALIEAFLRISCWLDMWGLSPEDRPKVMLVFPNRRALMRAKAAVTHDWPPGGIHPRILSDGYAGPIAGLGLYLTTDEVPSVEWPPRPPRPPWST